MKTCSKAKLWMLNPNPGSKISSERILSNFLNEAVNRSGVLAPSNAPPAVIPLDLLKRKECFKTCHGLMTVPSILQVSLSESSYACFHILYFWSRK